MSQLLTIRPGYLITPITIYINAALFVLFVALTGQVMWFPAETLAIYGGNFGPWTADGQWWRLLSSVFLHGGIMHLIFNCIILANIGLFLEPLLGRLQFALVYLFTGLVASLTSLFFNFGVVSVGASGAIFGLYGFFFALLLTDLFKPGFRNQFLKGTLVFVGINLALGFMVPMIDNAAHIGGLICGFVLGLLWIPLIKRRIARQQGRQF